MEIDQHSRIIPTIDQWSVREHYGLNREIWDGPIEFGPVGKTDGTNVDILIRAAKCVSIKNILETGTDKGFTARMLAKNCPNAAVYTIDITRLGSVSEDPANMVRIIGDARNPKTFLDLDLHAPYKISFAFIDGDHRYEGVIAESLNVLHNASPGCMIFWHDYHRSRNCGVIPALEWLKTELELEIIHLKGSWLACAMV